MSIDLQFDGTTEARGRNGWFQLREAQIYTSESQYPFAAPHQAVSVWMYSKSYGKFAPIYLQFHHPEELRTLICGLAKALYHMTHPEETTDAQ